MRNAHPKNKTKQKIAWTFLWSQNHVFTVPLIILNKHLLSIKISTTACLVTTTKNNSRTRYHTGQRGID